MLLKSVFFVSPDGLYGLGKTFEATGHYLHHSVFLLYLLTKLSYPLIRQW